MLQQPGAAVPTGLFYITLDASSTLSLPQFPALSVDLPAGFATAGRSFFLAVSDPAASPSAPYTRIVGPAALTGSTLSFPATAPPITFTAGASFTIAVYAVAASVAAPATYVHTIVGNTIVATPVGGGRPLTLAGPGTGLNNPISLDEDAAGTLYVLNQPIAGGKAGSAGAGSITEYPRGATGNAAPSAVLSAQAIDDGAMLRVVPAAGAIYLASTILPTPSNSLSGFISRIAPHAKGANVPLQLLASGNIVTDMSTGLGGRAYTYEFAPGEGSGAESACMIKASSARSARSAAAPGLFPTRKPSRHRAPDRKSAPWTTA